MKLLMISGDRSLIRGRKGPFRVLLDEFRRHFERIDILCPRDGANGPKSDWELSVFDNVHVHPGLGSLWQQPAWIVKKGRALISEHGHGVMTVHDYPPFYNGIGAKQLSTQTGVPAVQELHHIIGMPKAATIGEWIARTMSTFYLRRHIEGFAAVRTVNAGVRDFLMKLGVPGDKIHIVPSVYLDHDAVQRARGHEKKYDFVFCARLVDNKGLLAVLDALAKVPGRSLLVIGDGPLKSVAEAYAASYGLQSRVTFTGWLKTSDDVLMGIASGRAFLMNSTSEGNPRVAIEAMALGVPVIATRVGIMPDVIRDGVNGLFTTGRPDDLAAKMTEISADLPRLEAMGREATTIAGRFEKGATIKAYADFLTSVARPS